ncbi:MAG: methyltransferase domain-containing protein [Planctomycetaceae bacterium]|nr:methyltransferase domain-containing protein [Planctomycetaceae bacterium]
MNTDYLCIEPFIRDAMSARLLQSAFELGVIDRLAGPDGCSRSQLFRRLPVDEAGGRFLLEVLESASVLQAASDQVILTESFRATLAFRDLLLTKLQFAQLLAGDFLSALPQLLQSADDFMQSSTLFELFDYSRCGEVNAENCVRTARWMQLTTALTRYEGPVCCDHFDFAASRRMLDLGGNSGEFAVQVCRRHPQLQVTVGDLPVVCHVGQQHIADQPEAARIQFQPMHFLRDPFPAGFDLISFKSVLHDWPEEATAMLLQKCRDRLPPGGRLLIFERAAVDFRRHPLSYGQLPVLLFFRSYRHAETYTDLLNRAGFSDIRGSMVSLDVPFLVISASV